MTEMPDWPDQEEIERRFSEGARRLDAISARSGLKAWADANRRIFGKSIVPAERQLEHPVTASFAPFVAKHTIAICWKLAGGDPHGWRDLTWLLQCAHIAGALSTPEDRIALRNELADQTKTLKDLLASDPCRRTKAAATFEIAQCLFTEKSALLGLNNGLLPASKIKRNLDSRITKLMHKRAAKSPEDTRTSMDIADRLQTCRALLEQDGAGSRGRPTGKTENYASAMMSRALDTNIQWVNSLTDEETFLVLIMSYTKDRALAKSVAAQLRGPQSSRVRSMIAQLLSDLAVSSNGEWNPDRVRKELLALLEPGKGFAPGTTAEGSEGGAMLIESLMACEDIFSIVNQDAIRRHSKQFELETETDAAARAKAEDKLTTLDKRDIVRRELKAAYNNYWRRRPKSS
jgi:hypothetical protein